MERLQEKFVPAWLPVETLNDFPREKRSRGTFGNVLKKISFPSTGSMWKENNMTKDKIKINPKWRKRQAI